MDEWLEGFDFEKESGRGENAAMDKEEEDVGVASERLLLSQEEVYKLCEDFHDSDTELL